jgi:hypothetical protein
MRRISFNFIYILLALLGFSSNNFQLSAKPYYVSVTGSDTKNNGLDSKTPFLTISKAASLTNPGDTVFIMSGSYSPPCIKCGDVADITRSGTSKNWIVYKNYSGQSPVLQFDWWNGIYFSNGVSFIEINGLTIRGNSSKIKLTDALNQPGGCNNPTGQVLGEFNGNGITLDGQKTSCHHIRIKKTIIFECPGAGIASNQCDYITIDSCTIYNNCWYTSGGKSGIDLYRNWNVDNVAGYHNYLTNNKCFGNRLYVPWVGAPCKITDGNGIIIDGSKLSNGGSWYTGRTLIAFNIVVNNGGSGIHSHQSAHIDIVNNTAFQNEQSDSINRGEISAYQSTDMIMYNNILYASPNKNVNSFTYAIDTNLQYDYNLHFGGVAASTVGPHTITSNPLFTKPSTIPATADFSLGIGSPAIGKGLNLTGVLPGYTWPGPTGSAPDIGAVAYHPSSIKNKTMSVAGSIFPIKQVLGRNQVIIKFKQNYFNLHGEMVLKNGLKKL